MTIDDLIKKYKNKKGDDETESILIDNNFDKKHENVVNEKMTLCLSTFSDETKAKGCRLRLRHWPVMLPFDTRHKPAVLYIIDGSFKICEKNDPQKILMDSLPSSEIEEYIKFFKQANLIIDAVKTGIISNQVFTFAANIIICILFFKRVRN